MCSGFALYLEENGLNMKMQFRLVTLLLSFSTFCAWAQPGSVGLSTAGGTVIGTYNSLATAYAAIPNPLNTPVIIQMSASYTGADEVFPITFTEKVGASQTNTITIRPADTVNSIIHSSIQSSGAIMLLDGADWLIIDGSPGGNGSSRAWTLNNLASNGSTLTLINGATNNVFRHLVLQNNGVTGVSRCLFWSTAASQPEGNSFNTAEHNLLIGSRYGFNSVGTAANLNRKNIIRKNEITGVVFSGIWLQGGSGSFLIDSNIIYSSNRIGEGPFGILMDSQTDSVSVVNNRIYDLNGGTAASGIRGISVRSTLATGTNNYTFIANNFVSLTLPNGGSTSVIGLEYGGSNLVNAEIYHNTILIGGTLNAGGTSGNVLSAAFSKTASNAASTFILQNNLFLNTRSGGNVNGQHLALSLANNAGTLNLNHNTYNSTGPFTRIGTLTYSFFPDYVTALGGGNESGGNTRPVSTFSITDLSLAGASLGDTLLGAPAIAGTQRDLFGNPRHPIRVYRGAHEAIPSLGSSCSGTPTVGVASVNINSVCAGDSLTLSLSLPTNTDWQYQWQFSTAGGPYVNVPGATSSPVRIVATLSRNYRCIAVCANSGLADTSNLVAVTVVPVIGGLGISASPAGFTYTFIASAAAGASQFQWNFDDGGTDTGRLVSHTFTANRQHNVRVLASNSCFVDSASLLINITGVSVAEQQAGAAMRIWPNPAADKIFIETDFEVRQLQLLSVSGAVIRRWEASAEPIHELSLGDLAPGFYLLRAEGSRGENITKPLQRMR